MFLYECYLCSMKWIGERVSFVDDKKKTTFVIYPQQLGWQKSLMGAWFAMWLTIGGIIVWSFTAFKLTQQEQLILVVFLTFWFYYAVRVGRSFFWLLWGKELLKIDETSLTIKNTIRGYGKARSYFLENIQKIRVSQPKEHSMQAVWEASPWVNGGERLEFDYLGKTIRFGKKLAEKDAKLLFTVVTKRIEDQLKRKKD